MCNHNISKNYKVKEKYKNESTLVWASACSYFFYTTHTQWRACIKLTA